MKISDLWYSENEESLKAALEDYWKLVREENKKLEYRMDKLDFHSVKSMDVKEFYQFLHDEYYVWKYTAKNRLATTRKQLERYNTEQRLSELKDIQEALFLFNLNDIKSGLEISSRILGLGTAGASGLLSILYPEHFGTVDQFVIKSLGAIDGIPEKKLIDKINPDSISLNDGVLLIKIMRLKADQLNCKFCTDYWTPRKVDKVLWSMR